MSTHFEVVEEAVLEPEGIDRTDGTRELDMRDTFRVLFNDSAVRNYALTAFGALGMILLILLGQASDIGGLLILIVGTSGILFRWTSAPAFVLLILTYFMWTPTGIPGEGSSYELMIEVSRFQVTDMMLVLSVLVYVACHYRVLSVVSQAIAFEGSVRRKNEVPARRPPALIQSMELAMLAGICVALVVLGQLIWWFVNAVEVAPTEDFPLQWKDSTGDYLTRGPSEAMSLGLTRFVVLVGILFFGTLLARLAFSYWRMRMMGEAEAGMILLDSGWSETSRERQRQETWRRWGHKRAESEQDALKSDGEGKS